MDFELTEAQQEIVQQIRAMGQKFSDEYWRERDARAEFPVAAIEQQEHVARATTHDMREVMCLRGTRGGGAAFRERLRDIEAD